MSLLIIYIRVNILENIFFLIFFFWKKLSYLKRKKIINIELINKIIFRNPRKFNKIYLAFIKNLKNKKKNCVFGLFLFFFILLIYILVHINAIFI
jgi:hypothetical protein